MDVRNSPPLTSSISLTCHVDDQNLQPRNGRCLDRPGRASHVQSQHGRLDVIPETRSATPLESSISRTLSFSLLLIAFLQLLLTGEVHRFLNQDDDEPSEQVQSKYAIPTLLATTIYHSILSIHLYISGIRFLSTAHGILAFAGIMVQMFRNEGKISKRTGADKRTSGFLFKNASADAKHDRKRR
ncbi:hypothetical protein H2203_003294 [Taxawa tesnikishii (nom. ined.)]|nr:hypothetical protein H2203_003294 [Dothideales sp. JES 119]